MRILFCSHNPLDLKLGAPKVIMEVAGAMKKIGWDCTLAADSEICPDIARYDGIEKIRKFSSALSRFLKDNAANYDVVDYDHLYLPYARTEFNSHTLFVARSVLLEQHFETIPLPRFKGLKPLAGLMLKGPARYANLKYRVCQANRTVREADLVNVSNDHDRAELVSRGIAPDKIAVIPFGLSAERLRRFQQQEPGSRREIKIAFVGTFDNRKGGVEFPTIVNEVARSIPDVKFKLMGAAYRSREEVLSFFPTRLHKHLEIITSFSPDDLPKLLSDCSIGIFPSHIEGFGFGVLEMLAASLPVIAYDAPGPPMMLPKDYLAPRGEARELARMATSLLLDKARLSQAQAWARVRAKVFSWDTFAEATSNIYRERLAAKRL